MDHVPISGMCTAYVIIQANRGRPKRFWTRQLFKNNGTHVENLFKELLFVDAAGFRHFFRMTASEF